jgi:hypothetical protein
MKKRGSLLREIVEDANQVIRARMQARGTSG